MNTVVINFATHNVMPLVVLVTTEKIWRTGDLERGRDGGEFIFHPITSHPFVRSRKGVSQIWDIILNQDVFLYLRPLLPRKQRQSQQSSHTPRCTSQSPQKLELRAAKCYFLPLCFKFLKEFGIYTLEVFEGWTGWGEMGGEGRFLTAE